VGTEDELKERAEKAKSLQALVLDRTRLEPLIMSQRDLENWGYMVDIPQGPGGDVPHMEGQVVKCERCSQPFQVCQTSSDTECLHHWGKQRTIKADGKSGPPTFIVPCLLAQVKESEYIRAVLAQSARVRVAFTEDMSFTNHQWMTYIQGMHFHSCNLPGIRMMHLTLLLWTAKWYIPPVVFALLACPLWIAREKWSSMSLFRWMKVFTSRRLFISPSSLSSTHEAVCSDYNTRFSGVAEESFSKATLSLASIRKALDNLINRETILVGHALDNDLKAMRIVHKRCVDTAILFPHQAGLPYRRALKDL